MQVLYRHNSECIYQRNITLSKILDAVISASLEKPKCTRRFGIIILAVPQFSFQVVLVMLVSATACFAIFKSFFYYTSPFVQFTPLLFLSLTKIIIYTTMRLPAD